MTTAMTMELNDSTRQALDSRLLGGLGEDGTRQGRREQGAVDSIELHGHGDSLVVSAT